MLRYIKIFLDLVGFQGFSKGWVPSKLTVHEDDFAGLVWPLRSRNFFLLLKETLFKKFFPPVKTINPPAENVNETPAYAFAVPSKKYISVNNELTQWQLLF